MGVKGKPCAIRGNGSQAVRKRIANLPARSLKEKRNHRRAHGDQRASGAVGEVENDYAVRSFRLFETKTDFSGLLASQEIIIR
jgi:hypothetical protein